MRLLSSAFLGAFALAFAAGCGGSSSPLGGGNGSDGKSDGKGSASDGSSSPGDGTDTGSPSGDKDGSSSDGGTKTNPGAGGSTADHKRVFVTSVAYSGNMGGAAGADADCQTSANAQALGGTFKAWISTQSEDAIDRIVDVGPWYTTSKYGATKAFNNKSNLLTIPLTDLVYTETGDYASWSGYGSLWTGTGTDGRVTSESCSGWSSKDAYTSGTTGNGNAAQGWGGSSTTTAGCDQQNALICIEQ